MNTEEKYGIKKYKAVLLFVQMILTILLLAVSIYLLVFVSLNNLGGWMIISYVFIIVSVLAIIFYSFVGYKKGNYAYILAVIPFMAAVLVNILLPNRNAFQIALLSLLFALTAVFVVKQEDKKFNNIVALMMVVISLTFSIYSSITARIDFLGDISSHFVTYLAMYLSIFIPSIMSGTFALTYNVRTTRTI